MDRYLRWHGHHQRDGPFLPIGRFSWGNAGSVWLCPFDVFVGDEFHPWSDVVFAALAAVLAAAAVVVGLRIQPKWPTTRKGIGAISSSCCSIVRPLFSPVAKKSLPFVPQRPKIELETHFLLLRPHARKWIGFFRFRSVNAARKQLLDTPPLLARERKTIKQNKTKLDQIRADREREKSWLMSPSLLAWWYRCGPATTEKSTSSSPGAQIFHQCVVSTFFLVFLSNRKTNLFNFYSFPLFKRKVAKTIAIGQHDTLDHKQTRLTLDIQNLKKNKIK